MSVDEQAGDTRNSSFRTLKGHERYISSTLLIILSIVGGVWALQWQYFLPVAVLREQFLGLILGVGLAATFLITKSSRKEPGDQIPWYDWLLCACSLGVGLYITIFYPKIAYNLASLSPERYVLGVTAILLTYEATRRLLGWTLVIISLVFCACALFANVLPHMLSGRSSTVEQLAAYIYLDANGILGITLSVTAKVVVAFIIFGQALLLIKADQFFTKIALALLGRFRGGPAKVAVASSSLLGTVSGSVVSNVVISGSLTIPMMKRAGYRAPLAAGIEAVASTGGAIMPPVMGAAAFIMAEYVRVPYTQVALAAVIPAVLYYLCLLFQVDLESAKLGLKGLPKENIPKLSGVMRQGWIYLIPLTVLIYTLLIARWQPGKSAMYSAIAAIFAGAIYYDTRAGFLSLVQCVRDAGKVILPLIAISAIAGIVIGALQISGLTFKFALLLSNSSEGMAIIMLILTSIVCIILGLGMPTTVIYVMLAVLIAPALVQLGIKPMAANLFIFYFGMLSMITPPVCMGTFTAATIAETNFWTAGAIGARLGIVAYFVPFAFAFNPALLFTGSPVNIALSFVFAAIGVYFIAASCVGYMFCRLSWSRRVVLFAAGLLLFFPPTSPSLVTAEALGVVVGLCVGFDNRRSARTGAYS